jgi:hypothetical protein
MRHEKSWAKGSVPRTGEKKRGTAEPWIKEGKKAVKWTRLSCHDFVDSLVRLQLSALAHNLGNFLRRSTLSDRVEHWSLTTLGERLIKIGAKVVRHAQYVDFQMSVGCHAAPPFRNGPSSDRSVMPSAGLAARDIITTGGQVRRPEGKVCASVEREQLRSGLRPCLGLGQGLRTLLETSGHPRTAERRLDSGQFESTISCLKADCPSEDGQMGNPG